MRRKRNDVTVQLRKALRDEQITKHRNIVLDKRDEEFEFNSSGEITLENIKEGKQIIYILIYIISF